MNREQHIVDDKGKRNGVIIPTKRYEKLMEELHDMRKKRDVRL